MPNLTHQDALPAGIRLAEFEVQRVLGSGGFGIVYLAFDHALERLVAIKEFMPLALASRGEGGEVVLRAQAHTETFALGMRSFLNEARLLARFDHPSLVKVYRFWEAHGTAYMVMPYYQGRTLLQVRSDMAQPPDEAWLRRLVNPLLGALECLHREHVFHRDVAPDNILLLDDETGPGCGRPVLLDLGAARRVIGGMSQAVTAIVKPNFAPIEQYAETSLLRQGPWTDLYALAAVVHFCVTGRPPPPSTARAVHDELPGLASLREGLLTDFGVTFSESFVRAIDHALAVRPQERPDSVSAWREELSGIVSVPPGLAVGPAAPASAWPDGSAPRARQAAFDDVLAQTVLVRTRPDLARPSGHQALAEQPYMTTIPAAGRLHAAVTLPLPRPPGAADPYAATARAGAARAQATQATLGAPHTKGRAWWVAGAVALLLTALVALWWGQRKPVQPLDAALSGGGMDPALSLAHGQADAPAAAATSTAKRRPEGGAKAKSGDKADAPSAGGALNPRQACAGKSFIFLAICMKQRCGRSDYSRHPECERMRQQEASQRNRDF